MTRLWAGIDAGKAHHHCVAIDELGRRLFSRRVANDETELLAMIADVLSLAEGDEVVWATDLNDGGGALAISLLVDNGQPVLYIPGRTVHHASRTYRGDGKTDAKDAGIIADQARMRRDLHPSGHPMRLRSSSGSSRLTAPIWSRTGLAPLTGSAQPCWAISRHWKRPSITPCAKARWCC